MTRQVEEGSRDDDCSGVGTGNDEQLTLRVQLGQRVANTGLGILGVEEPVEEVLAYFRLRDLGLLQLLLLLGTIGEGGIDKVLPVLNGWWGDAGNQLVQTTGLEPDPEVTNGRPSNLQFHVSEDPTRCRR